MIIRIRHEDGTDRFQVNDSDTLSKLIELFSEKHNLPRNQVQLFTDIKFTEQVDPKYLSRSFSELRLKDGFMFFVNKPSQIKPSELDPNKPLSKSPFCNHSENIRCAKCYDWWKSLFTKDDFESYEPLEKIKPPPSNSRDIAYLKYLDSIKPSFKAADVKIPEGRAVKFSQEASQGLNNITASFKKPFIAWLYGSHEEWITTVDTFYVPRQKLVDEKPNLLETENFKLDSIAEVLGLRRVGIVYVNYHELTPLQITMSAFDQVKFGKRFITGLYNEIDGHYGFEAYQCIDILCKLAQDDSILKTDDEKVYFTREILVELKDSNCLEKDVLMAPIAVMPYESFLKSQFPSVNIDPSTNIGTVSSFLLMFEDLPPYKKWNDLNMLYLIGTKVDMAVAGEIAQMVLEKDPRRDDSGYVCLVNVSAS